MIEPNFQSIVITNAVGLVLLASLLASSYMTRRRRHLDDRMFTAMVLVTAGACILEPVTWFVDGNAEPWAFALNYLGNTYCYIGSCLMPYLWVIYVDVRLHKGSNRVVNWHPIAGIPVLLLAILNVGNLFGHYMFTISDANVYSRLPLSYLNYIVMFALFFYSVWLKHDYQRKHGHVSFFPMWMFLAPIFVGAGVQAALYGVSIAWPCVCIGLVSIHMSLQNELSYVDPLTNLYNRTYFDAVLQARGRSGERFSGIMVDVDFFKDINDTYGHSVGDEALAETAHLLVDAVPENALVIRFAGDEFIVLLPGDERESAESVVNAIEESFATFNAKAGKPYRLSLSMGASEFDPGADTVDNFLRRIDERMYDQKRLHHTARGVSGKALAVAR
ncbi:MAG: GGDEF domain-containing protein [Eggerthellaceae bacterium]|nr:GGDEF domain-containing protein [Eggerthellaceae bacterium]